jgi:hypothetical protein
VPKARARGPCEHTETLIWNVAIASSDASRVPLRHASNSVIVHLRAAHASSGPHSMTLINSIPMELGVFATVMQHDSAAAFYISSLC